jgi:hypothetical protein
MLVVEDFVRLAAAPVTLCGASERPASKNEQRPECQEAAVVGGLVRDTLADVMGE